MCLLSLPQIVYDDESVVGVKGKEGLLVNSVENNLPCAFFLRDDCYEDVMKSLPTLPQQIDTLLAEGLMVDGKKHGVEVCMGGDLKLLNGWLGLCGCSSLYPCIYCMAPKGTLHRSKAAWAAHGGLPQRFIERMVELAHKVLDYTYDCPAAGNVFFHLMCAACGTHYVMVMYLCIIVTL